MTMALAIILGNTGTFRVAQAPMPEVWLGGAAHRDATRERDVTIGC